MSERTRQSAIQIAVLILMFAALFNVAFYFLSDLYYQERVAKYGPLEMAGLPGARKAFAYFSGAVGLAGVATAFWPRLTGHALPVLIAIITGIAARYAADAELQPTLVVTLVAVDFALVTLVYQSLRGSRAGWSFLIAVCGVLALITVFGAPKARDLVGIRLWYALIVPGLLAVATIALTSLGRDYRDA